MKNWVSIQIIKNPWSKANLSFIILVFGIEGEMTKKAGMELINLWNIDLTNELQKNEWAKLIG